MVNNMEDRMTDNISSAFKVHVLNPSGIAQANHIAGRFSELLAEIEALSFQYGNTPMAANGREIALVRTHLQEACFWAKRAMAMNPANHHQLPEETRPA